MPLGLGGCLEQPSPMDVPRSSIGPVILRGSALSQGYSNSEIARLVRAEAVLPLRAGAYLQPAHAAELEPLERYRLLIAATMTKVTRPAVISHESAAAWHGLLLPRDERRQVHVTRRPPARSGARPTLCCHAAELEEDEIVLVNGYHVTSLTRTVADLARSLDYVSAVCLADDALHRRLITPMGLTEAAQRRPRVPDGRQLRRVAAFADGRSESPGESRSRIVLAGLDLPPINLQVDVRDSHGRVIARTDFGIPDLRVYGEFDGQVKYGRLLRPGQDPGEVVFQEKQREDQVRDTDAEVVRWVWREITARILRERWLRAIDRASRRSLS